MGTTDPNSHLFKTVFGFYTESRWSAALLNAIYVFLIPVEWVFANEGLKILLVGTADGWRWLAATFFVLLAVGFKTAYYQRTKTRKGRPVRFKARHAAICMLAATAVFFFDFVGVYRHLGVQREIDDMAQTAKVTVERYVTVMERETTSADAALQQEELRRTGEITAWEQGELLMLERRRVGAEQTLLDEKEGVRREGLTGVVGVGTQTRERAADVRRTTAANELESQNKKDEAEGKREFVRVEIKQKRDRIVAIRATLDRLSASVVEEASTDEATLQIGEVSAATSTDIVTRLSNIDSLTTLQEVSEDANRLMSSASAEYRAVTGKSQDPELIESQSGNDFDLAVASLSDWNVAGVVSLFIAFIFAFLDIFIAWQVRSEEDQDLDEGPRAPFEPEAALTDELPASGRRTAGPRSVP